MHLKWHMGFHFFTPQHHFHFWVEYPFNYKSKLCTQWNAKYEQRSDRKSESEITVHWLLLMVHEWPMQCWLPRKHPNGMCSFCCWLLVQQKDICVEKMHLKILMSAFFGPLCTGFSITKLQLLRIYLNTCWDYDSVSMHTTCATTPTHTRIHYCWQ